MDELTELQHDSSTAEATAPPDIRAIIQSAIGDMGLATSADVNKLSQRLETVEATLAEVPKKYASADSVSKVASSQASYQSNQHKLTKQVAEIANVLTDSGKKYGNIETRLNEFITLKADFREMAAAVKTLTDSITLFTSNQREIVGHHDARISNVEREQKTLTTDVTSVKDKQVEAEKVHDFINGSPTQKPLKETLSHFDATLNTLNIGQVQQSTVLKSLDDYVKAEKAKEEARRTYWRTIRLNWYTPRGIAIGVLAIIVILMVLNSFSFDQLIARIQQLAVLVELFRGK